MQMVSSTSAVSRNAKHSTKVHTETGSRDSLGKAYPTTTTTQSFASRQNSIKISNHQALNGVVVGSTSSGAISNARGSRIGTGSDIRLLLNSGSVAESEQHPKSRQLINFSKELQSRSFLARPNNHGTGGGCGAISAMTTNGRPSIVGDEPLLSCVLEGGVGGASL